MVSLSLFKVSSLRALIVLVSRIVLDARDANGPRLVHGPRPVAGACRRLQGRDSSSHCRGPCSVEEELMRACNGGQTEMVV